MVFFIDFSTLKYHINDISWFILVFKYVIYNMCEIYKPPEYLFLVWTIQPFVYLCMFMGIWKHKYLTYKFCP